MKNRPNLELPEPLAFLLQKKALRIEHIPQLLRLKELYRLYFLKQKSMIQSKI